MKELTDTQLLEPLSKGREQAYEELFRRFWGKVYHYVSVVIGPSNTSAAEDLAQNVFLKLWVHRESLPGIRSLDAWLFSVSSNEARDWLRHLKVAGNYAACAGVTDEYIDNLDVRYDYTLISNAIAACVEKMPPKRRQVWKMSRGEHLDAGQIAEKLGISHKTVDRHISLALKDIREVLGHLVTGSLFFFISNWV